MKHLIRLIVIYLITFSSLGQGEGSTFTSSGRGVSTTFATDYQALGINPANLGWDKEFVGKTVSFGFLETGFSFSAKIMNNENVKEIKSFPFAIDIDKTKKYNDFTSLSEDLQDGMDFQFDSRLFGIAVSTKRLGGFAFSITERYKMTAGLSKDFADLITYGFGAPYFDSLLVQNGTGVSSVLNSPSNFDSIKNDTSSTLLGGTSNNPKSISEVMSGTDLKISWIREFNFGYGRQLINTKRFGIYAGVSVKYMQGMAVFDLNSTPSNLSAFLSYSPTLADVTNPGFFTSGAFRYKLPKAAGSGFGFDFGLNIKAFKRIKLGVAINDLGSITWKENTFSAETDTALSSFKIGGWYRDSASISSGSGSASFDSILNSLVNIQNGNFERKVKLPTNIRIGASIHFGKILQIGCEMITPLNTSPGNFRSALYSFGGDLKLGPIKIYSGMVFQQGIQRRIPMGIALVPARGTYEIGISTRDVVSLLKFKEVDTPMLSSAFGFLRFRI